MQVTKDRHPLVHQSFHLVHVRPDELAPRQLILPREVLVVEPPPQRHPVLRDQDRPVEIRRVMLAEKRKPLGSTLQSHHFAVTEFMIQSWNDRLLLS
jgi:hypothetical protein